MPARVLKEDLILIIGINSRNSVARLTNFIKITTVFQILAVQISVCFKYMYVFFEYRPA